VGSPSSSSLESGTLHNELSMRRLNSFCKGVSCEAAAAGALWGSLVSGDVAVVEDDDVIAVDDVVTAARGRFFSDKSARRHKSKLVWRREGMKRSSKELLLAP